MHQEIAVSANDMAVNRSMFKSEVCGHFEFLQSEYGLAFRGIRLNEGDPRDRCLIARYWGDTLRVDIGWNDFESSLGVLILFKSSDIERDCRHIHLEPFIEFITNGNTKPIIPQIYPGMSAANIARAIESRNILLEHGFGWLVEKVAARLREHFPTICATTRTTLRRYHQWYTNHG